MADSPRQWTMESGQGRLDKQGIEWYACDPYPYWYRYDEDDKLIVAGTIRNDDNFWADE